MPRETETYRDRLAYNREKLDRLRREGVLPANIEDLTAAHAAALIGKDPRTIRKYSALYGFVDGYTTVEKISRAQSREPRYSSYWR